MVTASFPAKLTEAVEHGSYQAQVPGMAGEHLKEWKEGPGCHECNNLMRTSRFIISLTCQTAQILREEMDAQEIYDELAAFHADRGIDRAALLCVQETEDRFPDFHEYWEGTHSLHEIDEAEALRRIGG